MGKPNFSAELPSITLHQIEQLKPLFNGNKTQIVMRAIAVLHKQEMNMNTIANSASSICNYCGAIYNAKYGAHICDVDELQTLIDQERTMTDEPDMRLVAKLKSRIAEVEEFWKTHPTHQREVSHSISS